VDRPGVGDVRAVKVDMGQGPPVRTQPELPANVGGAAGVATIGISAVLALLCGGAGAWAYEHFLARPTAATPAAASPSQGGEQTTRKDLTGLEDRIKELSDRSNTLADQYKQLQSRLESIPNPTPAPDLAPLEQKVAQVDRLSRQVEAIEKKVDPLPQKLEQDERRIAELGTKLDDLGKQPTAARDRAPRERDRQVNITGGERPLPAIGGDRASTGDKNESQPPPAGESNPPEEPAIESGVSLFREKRYADAYADFRRLLQTEPDDARLWYYAALSFGLSTGHWERMTQTMVDEGIAREKAGKPSKPEIDAALAGLTTETGKDWLDFYRRRAR
jgi:TolA-binding protein